MTFSEAKKWVSTNNGSVRKMSRTADHIYFQIAIGPHVSDGVGVEHGGRQSILESDPEYQKAFVLMVQSLKAKIPG